MGRTKSADDAQTSRFGAERLYRDAASVASSTVVNATLGLAFWGYAARITPPDKLGVMTAVLAVITSTSAVLSAGVGDAFSAVGTARRRLYRRGRRLFLGLVVICGVGAAVATTTLLAEVRGSFGVGVLVAGGILVWSTFGLQNATLIALGRARWLPAANIVVNFCKIALLPLLAATVKWHSLELSFIIAAAVVVMVLGPAIGRIIDSDADLPRATMPDSAVNRTFDRFVAQTIVSSALSLGLLMVTPFLVTVFAGPTQGAVFALSFSIVQALDLVAAALTVSLVVHASSSPDDALVMARAVLIRAGAVSAVGAVILIAIAPVGLRMLNSQYGTLGATGVIAVLCAGTVVRTVYTVWIGLQKSRRNMRMPLIMQLVFSALLLALLPEMCSRYGALGGAVALLVAQTVLTAGAAGHLIVTRRRKGVSEQHG